MQFIINQVQKCIAGFRVLLFVPILQLVGYIADGMRLFSHRFVPRLRKFC
jgi:hypothetical protein